MQIPQDLFKNEFIDFKHGIRVGHLEKEQRITQILKEQLLKIFKEDFIIDHWGRGIFWPYIWFCPRANLKAKKFEGSGQFPSAKYFIGVDSERSLFLSGFYVESGYEKAEEPRYQRNEDWDWNHFINRLKNEPSFQKELERLIVKEGFELAIGFEENLNVFNRKNFQGLQPIRDEIERRLREDWVVVQVYYPLSGKELKSMKGDDIVQSIIGIWIELVQLLNGCLDRCVSPSGVLMFNKTG